MKEQLIDIISRSPSKQVSQQVKKHADVYNWVLTHSGETLAEKIYQALSQESQFCYLGNQKKFKSLSAGYGFCGPTSKCQCAKSAVSAKVSQTKSNYSDEKRQRIAQQRKTTVQTRYGVTNVGQLSHAQQARSKTYSNASKVAQITQQIKNTKLQRYKDANYNNADQIKTTFKKKRQEGFWIARYPEKNIASLEDLETLKQLYQQYTPQEIADQLNVHIQTVYKYLNRYKLREPFKSSDELELGRYISSLGIDNIVSNTRKILPSGKELDIFLPDYNIAIEYNGVYWHHEDVDHITRDYHYRKFKEAESLGIQLITVFSNFWHLKKPIVKQILATKLGKSTAEVVYARKCTVEFINNSQTKPFLNQYHIQGYTPAETNIGLFNNSKLVAVMSFSSARAGIGKNSSDIELVRFASAGRVVGGASKLLKAYRNANPLATIVSYSDNEWSTGHLYQTLGFNLDNEIKQSYWYLKPREHRLYHRFSFSKQKLVAQGHDSNMSESQITRALGLLKVWDCGKRKWKLPPNI